MKYSTEHEKLTRKRFVLDHAELKRAVIEAASKSSFWGTVPISAASEQIDVEFEYVDAETSERLQATVTRKFIYPEASSERP